MSADVLFLCPHHAAKSVLATAYFNLLAKQGELPLTADSGGTDPDEVVMPVVVTMLARDGIDVSDHQPRRVTTEELGTPRRIISMGCSAEELGLEEDRLEYWNDVPPVSQDAEKAREAIVSHIHQLINELKAGL